MLGYHITSTPQSIFKKEISPFYKCKTEAGKFNKNLELDNDHRVNECWLRSRQQQNLSSQQDHLASRK